jgi:hypothetical protein
MVNGRKGDVYALFDGTHKLADQLTADEISGEIRKHEDVVRLADSRRARR